MMPERAIFLLVEDSVDDAFLIRRAFQKANILNPLKHVPSGEEAIAYLSGQEPYTNSDEFPLPSIILLDLKLTGKDGFEVLEWIRSQPGLRNLPVIILTSIESLNAVDRAYKLGANSFLTKPVQFHALVAMMQAIWGFWVLQNRAPAATCPNPAPENLPH